MVLSCVTLLFSNIARAEMFWLNTNVRAVLTDEIYGGCMIRVDVELPESCNVGWVSLDCDGTYYDQRNGENKFAAAMMAHSGQKKVNVLVNDQAKHNGYCVARRLDVTNTPAD